jgi:hypothetical protein
METGTRERQPIRQIVLGPCGKAARSADFHHVMNSPGSTHSRLSRQPSKSRSTPSDATGNASLRFAQKIMN